MITTQKELDKLLQKIRISKEEGSFMKNTQARFERLIYTKDLCKTIKDQQKNMSLSLDKLMRSHKCQNTATTKIPALTDFKDDFKKSSSIAGYNFWEKCIGQGTSVDRDTFLQAYMVLYNPYAAGISLGEIKQHLAAKQGERGNQVNIVALFTFTTLVDQHGFPFSENTEILEKRRRELSDEARIEVTKMVMKLMYQFTSKDMQANYLTIEQLHDGVKIKHKAGIEKRAAEWGALRKKSRLLNEAQKSKKHEKADEIDFARRSASFLYQRYIVLWRVGQLERDTLKEVDFPGTGRIREFLAFYRLLDKVNYHGVRRLDPGRWPGAEPNVYRFFEQLIRDKTKEAEEELAAVPEPKASQPMKRVSTYTTKVVNLLK